MTTKTSSVETAAKFVASCRQLGFSYSYRNSIVSVTRRFEPNDSTAYINAEGDANDLLALVPASGGSLWGTDSGSIGGAVGLAGGYCTLNQSGVQKRFIAALAKIK